jgi:GNAT superfamily N-acetyltransferase
MRYSLPTFLPGELSLQRGTVRDYIGLEQFHYLPKRPATWADIWRICYMPLPGGGRHGRVFPVFPVAPRVVAVGVLSYPVPSNKARERYLHRTGFTRRQNLTFANANLRTISRVVVHPQFRSLGLSTILVKCLCDHCDTRYVEAAAMMARAHPFFEKAGMTRIDPPDPSKPVYFIFDRAGCRNELTQSRYGSGDRSLTNVTNLLPCNPRQCA